MSRRCEDSWFAEYLEFTKGQESPELFHLFVAMSIISATLDRKVKMDKKYFELYPNTYTILVAGTSKCHKSACIGIGMDLLSKIENPPRKFAQKLTNERLIQFLGENIQLSDIEEGKIEAKSSGIIAADELSSFLGTDAMDTGIITTLTDLYGASDKWEYQTKSSGRDTLNNVYITFLGASTGRWLREAIPEKAVGGGFISRCMFLYQDSPKRLIPFPEDEIPDNIEEIEDNLLHDLNHISNLSGNFRVSKKAKEWYKKWYRKNAEEIENLPNPDFFSRWDTFMLKLGMIVSVARSDELLVKTQDFKMSEFYLDSLKKNMSPVLDTLTTAKSELPTSEVLGLIKRRRKLTHQQLMNLTRRIVNTEGLKTIVQTLEEAGQINVNMSASEPTEYTYTGKEEEDDDEGENIHKPSV